MALVVEFIVDVWLFLMGETDVYGQCCCADDSTKPASSVPDHQGRKTELSIHSVLDSGQLSGLVALASVCQELLNPTDCLL